jgi:hypothetical protein
MTPDQAVETWLRHHLDKAPNVVAAQARTVADLTGITSAVGRKTRLVVAADPNSESTKARRARELGIPLIAEQVFLTMLQRGVTPSPVAARARPT